VGYRFTTRARDDLRDIGAYTRDRWGEAQADLYLSALERRCQEMADAPRLRRVYEDAPSYFRSLVGRHAIFYRPDGDTAILIVRILHGSMLPELHLPRSVDDDDEDDAKE
jgi:toxin ParE1/3/4